MNLNPTNPPTQLDYHRQCETDHHARPRGTTLGAGCCDWCGRPREECDCVIVAGPAALCNAE